MTNNVLFDLPAALVNLRPGASWVLEGDTYDKLIWKDENQTKPTEQECQEEMFRLWDLKNNTQYRVDRADAYPSIGDQLDALFHSGVFPEEMAAKIQAVKDQFPKPTVID